MTKWIINNRHWLLAIISVVIVVIHSVDLRHQVQDSKADNHTLGTQLKQIVVSDLERTFTSFEYIANDIIRHHINQESPFQWTTRAEVITEIAFSQGGVLTHLHANYGLTETSLEYNHMVSNSTPVWRLNYDEKGKTIALIMGKVVVHKGEQLFFEVEFQMTHYPPFIPYQMNAVLVYVGSDGKALLRGYKEFESVVFGEQTNPSSAVVSDKRVISVQSKELLTYQYVELNGDTTEQHQIINIPVKQLNGTMTVLINSTEQLESIHEDMLELLVSIVGLVSLYFVSTYTLKYLRKTQRAMNTDVLTGLKNRRHLDYSEDKIQQNLLQDKCSFYGVLLIDVDHFKRVNDTYGHGIGDKVLSRIGQILLDNVRQGDECYRLGGEEFAVTAPVRLQSQIISLAQRLREAVEKDEQLHELIQDGVTASVGVSALSIGDSLEQCLNRADTQLYLAKNNGRNLVQHPADLFAL